MSRLWTKAPKWLEIALQGLTYWIGHRRCHYNAYPLGEAALVAELCNLVHSNLDKSLKLHCEVQYTKIIGGDAVSDIRGSKARADLVIEPINEEQTDQYDPDFIIEIKRSSAGPAQIDLDMQRLAEAKKRYPKMRAFLIVVAESEQPARFVNEDGVAIKTDRLIPKTNQVYSVRRVLKAAHSFSNKGSAQYACLIEVSDVVDEARLKKATKASKSRK